MASEALNIHDKTFLISRLIQQAPKSTVIREFFKNAEENAALDPTGLGEVRIYPTVIDQVRKLTFFNTGVGMDEVELRTATKISASIRKSMGLDGNFGIGAKVSGLAVSPHGIRYRSCKDGVVNEVTIGFDEQKNEYVRFGVQFEDGQTDTVYDVTEHVRNRGMSTEKDWTEVVLMGSSADHDTVAEPLQKGDVLDRSFIPSDIFRRFSTFLPGVKLHVDTAMTKGGGKDQTGTFRSVKPLETILGNQLKYETVTHEEEKVSIRYIHDPKHSSGHSTSSTKVPAVGSNTFCALVHKGERYDYKTRRAWSAVAPNFGVPFGSKVISIEILLDDSAAAPNQYRDGLTNPDDRSPLATQDFDFLVRELMPGWVKQIIQENSPQSQDNLEDLQSELQKYLDEFKVPTPALRKDNSKYSQKAERSDDGDNTSKPYSGDVSEFPDDIEFGENNRADTSEISGQRADSAKVRSAPKGAKVSRALRALEQVPKMHILEDPNQIDEKLIKGKAASYYKDSQEIFVNGLYPAVSRMASELELLLVGKGESELVRGAALQASRRAIAKCVGKGVVHAISKRLVKEWSAEDLEKATTPEALSLPADDYRQMLPEAKRYALQQIQTQEVKDAVSSDRSENNLVNA